MTGELARLRLRNNALGNEKDRIVFGYLLNQEIFSYSKGAETTFKRFLVACEKSRNSFPVDGHVSSAMKPNPVGSMRFEHGKLFLQISTA
jgi:hypothetical protein